MIPFLTIGLALLAVFVITKIIGYISLRAGMIALGIASVIFLMGLMH